MGSRTNCDALIGYGADAAVLMASIAKARDAMDKRQITRLAERSLLFFEDGDPVILAPVDKS